MTITLAAVYAPIGFQGGLTGALFREFAFTLAGAVFISGIVALTLSPMMSSRLLKRRAQAGLARARHRPRLRRASSAATTRALDGTLAARARGLRGLDRALAAASCRCTCSRRQELAPNEDQGVVFGAIDVPAERDARAAHALHRGRSNGIFATTPEFDHSFQITFPTGGFGGMLVKPWERAEAQHLPDPGRGRARKLGDDRGRPRARVPAVGAAERAASSRSSS